MLTFKIALRYFNSMTRFFMNEVIQPMILQSKHVNNKHQLLCWHNNIWVTVHAVKVCLYLFICIYTKCTSCLWMWLTATWFIKASWNYDYFWQYLICSSRTINVWYLVNGTMNHSSIIYMVTLQSCTDCRQPFSRFWYSQQTISPSSSSVTAAAAAAPAPKHILHSGIRYFMICYQQIHDTFMFMRAML